MNSKSSKLIINGVTENGKKFRPSDWAQRLTGAVATYGPNRRVKFHPSVRMATWEGINCVVIETAMEQEDPMLFEFLINFGRENNLKLTYANEFPPAQAANG